MYIIINILIYSHNMYIYIIIYMWTLNTLRLFRLPSSSNDPRSCRATVRALLRFQILALAHQNAALVGSTDHLQVTRRLLSNEKGKIVVFRFVLIVVLKRVVTIFYLHPLTIYIHWYILSLNILWSSMIIVIVLEVQSSSIITIIL